MSTPNPKFTSVTQYYADRPVKTMAALNELIKKTTDPETLAALKNIKTLLKNGK